MTKQPPESANERESRRILDAASVQSDVTGASAYERSMKRARNHMNAADKQDEDWIERTGTRIGRWISVLLFVVLVIWLLSYFIPGPA